LREYRDGARESGFMEPVASRLEDQDIEALAGLYARLSPVPRAAAPQTSVERGLELATLGLPTRNVAACQSCHSGAARSDYPSLAGQPQAYLQAQLDLWRRGGRAKTDHGRTMAVIARQLTEQEIASVTAYYAGLPPAIAAPPPRAGVAP
jgi:cytochrome c553